ncbi:MAG: N,N'-diacetylchitobiose phosphorylase [Chitinivibrionales bacterium]|nr:N,N'-diacetylchitobiose phosphorylase [Chitinivibrionales bacterium]
MQYGHFDDKNREYVVDRPDTPRSWTNYSGSRNYGAIVTNNAGGYSFYRSSAIGRFLRLRFNAVPMDQPGRYFYLRDRDSADYWSASWQPVGKPLEQYRSACRFGTSYTIIESEYDGIASESTYFVPLEQSFEYWRLKLTNRGDKQRSLSVFTFCEFASEWNIFQDGFNLQYSAYCVRAEMLDGIIRCASLNNVAPDPDNFKNGDQGRWCWMALVGADIAGYELDREKFLGPYRSYDKPLTVERGECGGSQAYGDNACGCMQVNIDLGPGESRELLVLLGVGKAEEEGRRTVAQFGNLARAADELTALKQDWHSRLGAVEVQTPDADFDHMINVWNPYNSLITFYWSRAASLVYTGDSRDGFGYRDTVQDCLGALPLVADEVRERLELMITGQNSTGGAMPEVKPYAHRPGHMPTTADNHYRSDDCLWLFNAVPAYVAETGDIGFYDKVLPYCDRGEASVLGHLRRALEFNLEHTGAHGLPCGMVADWNDCLKLGFKGESVFVAMQLRYGLVVYEDICQRLERENEATWARQQLERFDRVLDEHAWDGAWYRRAFRENGEMLGSSGNEEGRVFLNPQSWAVIGGAADDTRARAALDAVDEHLATDYGVMVCTPPFVKADYHDVRAVLLNPGQKENAGIFSHPQGWIVMANTMVGNGDRAYRYYRAFMPSRQNDIAEIREVEPYVHCQSTDSVHSPRHGLSHVPWLSGTASWAYHTATNYILGIRPEMDGLTIDPCIPASWDGFTAQRSYRGKRVSVTVRNPRGVQKGVRSLTVNGEEVDGCTIPIEKLSDENEVVVIMG